MLVMWTIASKAEPLMNGSSGSLNTLKHNVSNKTARKGGLEIKRKRDGKKRLKRG